VTSYLPPALGLLALLVILAIASGAAAPLRRRAGVRRAGAAAFFAQVVPPLLVLLLTPFAAWLLGQHDELRAWVHDQSRILEAWQAFWVGALVIAVVEGMARQVWALRRRPFPLPDLLDDILRGIGLLLLAFFVLKGELGWDIGPLLASTALLTAVVGFALQGVLGNLLAGMSLHITRTVSPGDWIMVGDVEGKVTRTNWRETRLQSVNHEEMIVPNARLSDTTVHNLSQPTPKRRHRIDVGASYSDAPDEVIAALVEAAREIPEVLDDPAPHALITAFADYGINYRLFFWTEQYHLRGTINGHVCRHVWYKFKRRGIEIPFPMSDKLLNDFMTVVNHQRDLPPEAKSVAATVRDLLASDLRAKLVVDDGGAPLLSEDDLRAVAPLVRRELWTRGETLMRQGDDGETFYVIASGKLDGVVSLGAGQPSTSFQVGPGAVVGEMGLLTGAPRGATLTTATSCELLAFDRAAFVALLGLRPEVPQRLADLAATRQAANLAAADAARQALAARSGDSGKEGILRRLLGFLGR
jgi:small-conductance mechanosensitive channel/CRP-like cAMP-binding protein